MEQQAGNFLDSLSRCRSAYATSPGIPIIVVAFDLGGLIIQDVSSEALYLQGLRLEPRSLQKLRVTSAKVLLIGSYSRRWQM